MPGNQAAATVAILWVFLIDDLSVDRNVMFAVSVQRLRDRRPEPVQRSRPRVRMITLNHTSQNIVVVFLVPEPIAGISRPSFVGEADLVFAASRAPVFLMAVFRAGARTVSTWWMTPLVA